MIDLNSLKQEKLGVWKVPVLRDYEREANLEIRRRLPIHSSVLAVGPTGCGKTVIAASVIENLSGARVLWLAHRVELLNQAALSLRDAGVPLDQLGIYSGQGVANEKARVLVSSVDMYRGKKIENVPKFDLCVIDEAHRSLAASYLRILGQRPRAWVLGLTATPWRLDGQGLGDVYKDLFTIAEYDELAVQGWLVEPTIYGLPDDEARALVKGVKVTAGDYSVGVLGRKMMRLDLMGRVVEHWVHRGKGKKTIVFAVSRAHGMALHREFSKVGKFDYLDGETPAAERDEMVGKDGRLARGEIDGVVNVDVLSEGFDCPNVKCIVSARPTHSLTRYRQQFGRGSRPDGDIEFVGIDHAGNHLRFGQPHERIEWSLDERQRKRSSVNSPPSRTCVNPKCQRVIAVGCSMCPHCGKEQPKPERLIIEHDVELQRLESNVERMNRQEQVLRRLAELKPELKGREEEWVQRAMSEMGAHSSLNM